MPVHESRSVLRILAILELLGRAERPLSLTEIARATEIDPSTAYRMLRVLCSHAFVHRTQTTRQYSLGFGAFRLGAHNVFVQSIGRHAQIHLLRLASDIGETARLAVLEGSDVRFCAEAGVYERPGSRMLGALMDAHASAAGKVLLAWRSTREVEQLYLGKPLRTYTGRTIRSIAALHAELAKVRARGVAVSEGEALLPGIRSIAAPCRDETGQVPMAVVISGPVTRLPPARDAEIIPKLVAIARDIAEALGLRGPAQPFPPRPGKTRNQRAARSGAEPSPAAGSRTCP